MRRHFLPAVVAMVVVSAGLISCARQAEAQVAAGAGAAAGTGLLADPFSFYYAIYLPNQQLQAMRPTPLDSVNDAMVSRQYFAQTNRRGLSDPISPFAETYDPLRPYSNQQERLSRPHRFVRSTSNAAGSGPSLYFNRISQYYPDMAGRTGTHKNANVSARRSSIRTGGGGGGMGMGGMGGMGMGGGGMGMF